MSIIKELKFFWDKCGINKGENLLLHSNFKRHFISFKKKSKTFEIKHLFESLLDIILPNGTILFPTFNFDFNKGLTYDYYRTPSKMGSLTEFARLSNLDSRTLNPVYSFSVFGKMQNEFKSLNNISWYSNNSPFNLIKEQNFKIFILDLQDNDSMTFLHYCEECFQVDYRNYKFFTSDYIGPDKKKKIRTYKGFVRKFHEGVITYCNPAGKKLWDLKKYKGDLPFKGTGMRNIYAKDYYDFFKNNFEKKCLEGLYYKKL